MFATRLFLALLIVGSTTLAADEPLQPWKENPWYWSVDGQPVLLLGGSDDDNLFQWPAEELIPQLDRIAACGGNVVRNTMSDRKDRGWEEYPFLQLESGRYDLAQWNPVYWRRFERFLSETAQRDIFIQIEIWDRFDYTDKQGSDHWQIHPYRPENNVNYSYQSSGFAERYPEHPGQNKQPFFFTTPAQRNNTVVLEHQQRFVHKLLDHALRYDHVLYCIDNETKAQPEWARYWTKLIRDRAADAGKRVMITEMWDDWDLKAERHRQTFDHPELYDYVDVSQNNHNSGQEHWDNFLFVRNYLSDHPRPINTTKTYGASGNKFGHTDQDAIERFWRHLLAGAASIRFHRPDSGLGINDRAVGCIRAARKLEERIPLWTVEPAGELLKDRSDNEAYLAASQQRERMAIYFPAGEEAAAVRIDLTETESARQVQWIDIDSGELGPTAILPAGGHVTLSPPGQGNLAAAITAAE